MKLDEDCPSAMDILRYLAYMSLGRWVLAYHLGPQLQLGPPPLVLVFLHLIADPHPVSCLHHLHDAWLGQDVLELWVPPIAEVEQLVWQLFALAPHVSKRRKGLLKV